MHPEYFTAPHLDVLDGLRHGFFTRQGGVSEGLYSSLNCGKGSGDVPGAVEENCKRVMKAMDANRLQTLYQIHSADVVMVNHSYPASSDRPQADAMVTNERGIALGILTADCVPVLFADASARVVGAAHAGWKGAFGGVVAATVKTMQEHGARPNHIVAAIGPAIAQESYQVDALFHAKFVDKHPQYQFFFEHDDEKTGHYLFDLKGFVKYQCEQAGIAHCEVMLHNTYLQESEFYSYRRATHRQEADYGRQISAIMLY